VELKWLLILFAIVIPEIVQSKEVLPKNQYVLEYLSKLSSPDGPGVQYIVLDKNEIIFSASQGLADIKNKKPLNVDHTMSIFSMTKTLTAISVLQLVERKKLDLDDKISMYVEHPYNPNITIRHILSHTSGIPDPIPLKWVHLAGNHDKFDEQQSLSKVLNENSKPNSLHGEKYEYSNIGYWLLGGVIERVSGTQYCIFVQKNITNVLGLSSKEIGCEVIDKQNHAKGYLNKYSFINLAKYFVMDKKIWGEYEGSWLRINNVYINGPSFGGIISSANAISRILQDLLKDESLILDSNMKNQLYTQQKTTDGEPIDMTLGWHIGNLSGSKYYFKEGGGAGFHCEMRIYPDKGLASVIIVNKTSLNTKKELSKLDSSFINKYNKASQPTSKSDAAEL